MPEHGIETVEPEFFVALRNMIVMMLHTKGVMVGTALAFMAGIVMDLHDINDIPYTHVENFARLLGQMVGKSAGGKFDMLAYLQDIAAENNEMVVDITLRKITEGAKS